jgi:hypothetical protein
LQAVEAMFFLKKKQRESVCASKDRVPNPELGALAVNVDNARARIDTDGWFELRSEPLVREAHLQARLPHTCTQQPEQSITGEFYLP